MGILDSVIKAAHAARDQAGVLAHKHGDKIDKAIDKGGSMIDQHTQGKYADKVAKAQGMARDAAGKGASEAEQSGSTDQSADRRATPPPPPGPTGGAGPTPPPPPPSSAA